MTLLVAPFTEGRGFYTEQTQVRIEVRDTKSDPELTNEFSKFLLKRAENCWFELSRSGGGAFIAFFDLPDAEFALKWLSARAESASLTEAERRLSEARKAANKYEQEQRRP